MMQLLVFGVKANPKNSKLKFTLTNLEKTSCGLYALRNFQLHEYVCKVEKKAFMIPGSMQIKLS